MTPRRCGSHRRSCRPTHCPAIAAGNDKRGRSAKSIEDPPPWLDLLGISTGDFHETLAVLPGRNAAGLPSTTIARRKADWWDECDLAIRPSHRKTTAGQWMVPSASRMPCARTLAR